MIDLIVPTNGATMAVIALVGINYKNWIQFIVKPVLLMLAIGAIAILVAVRIGYN